MVGGLPILNLTNVMLNVEEALKHGQGNAILLHPTMADAIVKGFRSKTALATPIHVQV